MKYYLGENYSVTYKNGSKELNILQGEKNINLKFNNEVDAYNYFKNFF